MSRSQAAKALLRHLNAPKQWMAPSKQTPVYVMMSGGVDSSVCARLLLEQGYQDLRPVYMRNWDTLDEADSALGGCEWERDWHDVQTVCRQSLGGLVPELIDLSKEYWTDVFQPSLDMWSDALTPNPDVSCNRHIKFDALPNKLLARQRDAWVASGHYARLTPSPIDPARPALLRAAHLPKDQSYYLSQVPIESLQRTMFPLGTFSKPEVREMARKWSLPTSERDESMGICFVGEKKRFSSFLESYLTPNPGPIVLESGRVVGQHNGLWRYTVGEGARIGGLPERMFVGKKDTERNELVIMPASSPALQCVAMTTADFAWIDPAHPPVECEPSQAEGFEAVAQIRSLPFGATSPCCVIRRSNGSHEVTLSEPIRGVSPGQFVVLYLGDWCLGGGTIARTTTLADLQDHNQQSKFENAEQPMRMAK